MATAAQVAPTERLQPDFRISYRILSSQLSLFHILCIAYLFTPYFYFYQEYIRFFSEKQHLS